MICGFGRLGTWFAVERFGLAPDLIVFAKGVTSGYLPRGGVIVRPLAVGLGVSPPLNVTREHLDPIVATLLDALDDVYDDVSVAARSTSSAQRAGIDAAS